MLRREMPKDSMALVSAFSQRMPIRLVEWPRHTLPKSNLIKQHVILVEHVVVQKDASSLGLQPK